MATGGDLVAKTLKEFGVEVAFGLHGGHLDAMLIACHRSGIRLVDTRHEAVAVNAADGYARATGRLGVAFATAASGFSNAVAGFGPAMVDRSPVLVVTGSPPLRDAETNALQGSIDQVALAAPVTKWAHRVTAIDEIPRLVGLATRRALAGPPGPVVVDLPIDMLFGTTDERRAPLVGGTTTTQPPGPAPAGVAEAVELLRGAERPVIVAGSGLRGPAPNPALVEFAELTGIPVFYPGMIIGAMPPDHRLNGYGARNLGALTAAGSGPDAVVLAGSRFGLYLGGRGGAMIPPDARVIEIDLDPTEFGRVRPFDVGIVSDAGLALQAMSAAVRERTNEGEPWPDLSDWAALATAQQARPPAFAEEPAQLGDRMHPYHGVREVLRHLPGDATLVIDGGEFSHWIAMSMHEARPRRGMGCGYLGYLGMTPGMAIGAALAEPDRRVVLLMGDGGAGFHPQEFDTMVRHGLPILTVVVNNACWGMSLHGQELLYGAEAGVVSVLADTAYEKVAEGFGAFGVRASRIEEVEGAIKAALAHDGPSCLNLAVDGGVMHPVTQSMLGMVGTGGTLLPYYDNLEDDE